MNSPDGPEARMIRLGLLPEKQPHPAGDYVPVRRAGDLVTTASISAKRGGELRYLGLLGSDLTVEQGRASARDALLNCLSVVRAEIGSLDAVRQVIKITGYVASAPGFVEQHKVMDGASQLCGEIFGEAGRHVRAAVGVAALPANCSVGVELTVQVAPET